MYRREHTRHRTDHKLHSAGAACRQHAAAGGQLGEIEKYGFTGTRYANRYNNVRLVKNMGPASPQPVSSRPRGASNTIYAAHAGILLRGYGARGDLPRCTLSPRDLELSERHEVALEVARGPWRSAKRLLADGGEGGRDRDLPEGGAVLVRVRVRVSVRVIGLGLELGLGLGSYTSNKP